MILKLNATALKQTVKLLAVPVVFVLTLSFSAAELNPADNINPSESELNNHPQQTALKLDEKMAQSSKDINAKSKPSWWKWLTSTSKKPAYFHYIDIIELLD